ncbi:hypothetical protein QBC39DRAFT_127016 [Podospora conica]|nr:hypothetical protein QBC39DRAFT_127016 [Schizothecium conicum]
MASVSSQPPGTMTARQLILQHGDSERSLAPIYHGILKHLNSASAIINFLQAVRPANKHWKVEKNAASILWPMFLQKIPYFQEVIVAVRMTNRVVDHERSLNLNNPERIDDFDVPQVLLKFHSPLKEVPGLVKIPSLNDIKQALGLHHLSEVLARRTLHRNALSKRKYMEKGMKFPTECRLPAQSMRQLRQAIIRSFVAGATLAEFYTQPLDRCRVYYNYLRATRWVNNGSGPTQASDVIAAASAFNSALPHASLGPAGYSALAMLAIITMGLIGFDEKTTKIDACQAAFLRKHAVYQTDTAKTTPDDHLSEMMKQQKAFGQLDQWLMYVILSDTTARASFEENFSLVRGHGATCPGESNCPLSLLHFSAAHLDPTIAPHVTPAVYTHADAHFVV